MTYKKVRTTGLSLPVYNFVQSLPPPPTLQGITPRACLKPFNYDRYSLSESLVFAARIIICLLLKSNTVLKTVPSWDQPVGLNTFYKKKKKNTRAHLFVSYSNSNRLKHKNNGLVASFTGHALYDVCNHSMGVASFSSICRPGGLSFPDILKIARKTTAH